jgi:lipoate-protein ligase A
MNWYLIQDGAANGARNMAKDECLLRAAVRWNRPVLRLYAWARPTLSLGRNQRTAGALDAEACRRESVPIVRRITGGWAVLHGDDLTYSVVAPLAEPRFGTTIHSTYMAIAEVFAHLFGELGFAPALHRKTSREQAAQASPICFVTPSTAELLIDGRKLIGSAQRRGPDAFLQHGSIPLRDRSHLLTCLFHGARERDVAAAMTDLDSIGVWSRTTPDAFRSQLLGSFERVMDAQFEDAPWGEAEEAETARLEPGYPPVDPVSLGWVGVPPRADARPAPPRGRH